MTKLANKIISINSRRTSMRLCHKEWNALEDVCEREHINRNKLIELIENSKNHDLGLTYSTRLFLMLYFRDAARPAKPIRLKEIISPNIARIIKEIS